MKYIPLVLAITSPIAMATQMVGFGANYYRDDSSIPNYDTNKDLVPNVIVGDNVFVLEFNSLTDIAKSTAVSINHGEKASWLCLVSKGVNYWFISDNEMGQGDLTSIAIAKAEPQKDCSIYNGDLSILIKGVSLLDASPESFSSTFQTVPDGNTVQYCANTHSYGNFTQINCLQYYLENKSVKGVFISQITSN